MIADGFKIPAAANIDPQNRDNLYVVDTGTGRVWSVSLTSKAKQLVASLKPGLDNLAFDLRGRLFVTSMTDNGIYLVDKRDRRVRRTMVEGKLAIPADIAVVSENGKDTVHVADVFSYRTVDGQQRRGRRRAARAWRHPCLSDRHLGRAQARAADRAGSPTPSRRSTARPASWSPRSATSRRRSMRSRRPTARSMSPSSAAATWSR